MKTIFAWPERMIVRLDAALHATLPTLATKSARPEKPCTARMWGIPDVLTTAIAAGPAAMAVIR